MYSIIRYMLQKLLLIGIFLLYPFNGYYQTTRIEFEGMEEPCYGTLLSKYSESGSFSTDLVLDLNAPKEVLNAFQNYQDKDKFLYLNYFQDVSGGLLYWPYYPPKVFKVLLYYPETNTFLISDTIETRYALTSVYKATIKDGTLHLERNYDYLKLIFMTLTRTILSILISIGISFLIGKPRKHDYPLIIYSNILFYIFLNILISWISYKIGFNMLEHIMFLWLPYLLFILLQGYLYDKKANSISHPYFCSFFSNVATYAIGLALLDFVPRLFTII